jgi:ADP compounds hydrolase
MAFQSIMTDNTHYQKIEPGSMPTKPTILKRHRVAQSRLFQIEQLDLKFSNGVERTYERLASSGYGAVAIVPITSEGSVILVQEYGAGINDYQWGVPKGAIDPGETHVEAANRELMEEAGVGARSLRHLKNIHLSPSYMERSIDVVYAEDLYKASLPGDEPEPLATMEWPMSKLSELVSRDDISDGISIAALYLVRDYLDEQANS